MGAIDVVVCNNSLINNFALHLQGPWFNSPSIVPKTSLEIGAHDITLHTKQQGCRTIARKLGTTPSTISCTVKHFGGAEKLEDKGGRSRCSQILSERDNRYLARLVQIKIVEYCSIMLEGSSRGFKYHNFI